MSVALNFLLPGVPFWVHAFVDFLYIVQYPHSDSRQCTHQSITTRPGQGPREECKVRKERVQVRGPNWFSISLHSF